MPHAQDTQFLRLSDRQVSQLTAQVIQHRDETVSSRADFPLRHADRYRRYLTDPTLRPPGPWPGSAKLFMPTSRDVFEKLYGEVWQQLFANPMQIQFVPFGEEDFASGRADMNARFLRWALGSMMEWVTTSRELLFDGLMDSVGVCKIMAWEPPWEAPSPEAKRYLSRTVRADSLDLGMFGVAPDATGLQYPKCRYLFQEFFLASDDVWRMSRRGFDTPDSDELGASQEMTDRKRVELEREGERVVEFHPDSIPFVESYERFILDDDQGGEVDLIVSWFPDAMVSGTSHDTSGNHGRLAGVRKLTEVFPQDDRPRRPFFPLTFWQQPRQWRGLNVMDRLESMQDLINRLHEQMVNYGEVSMLPYVFANVFLTGEVPDLRSVQPGSTVVVDDIGGLKFAPTQSMNRHFGELIQLIEASVEKDSQVTDFGLGRQSDRPNAQRTARGLLALLGEAKKSYTMLARGAAAQVEAMYTFAFRLWQEVLPDNTFVQIFEPDEMQMGDNDMPRTLWDRLFDRAGQADTGVATQGRRIARPMSRDDISGLYDVKIEINPDIQFDRQVLPNLYQMTAPEIVEYPLGRRLMLKHIWDSFSQKGFDDIYPEEVAILQTQQRLLTVQAQLATAQQQLDAVQQQEAQQQLDQFGQGMEQLGQEGGAISPQFAQTIQALLAGQANGTEEST